VIKRDGGACVRCGSATELAVHHIQPLGQGGDALDDWGLETLCSQCHKAAHR
jgi:5-methylcytosine-specific restriction endonuclease McrA